MSKKSRLVFAGLIVWFVLACNATFTVGFPTPTVIPSPAEQPTAIPTQTVQPLTISTLTYEEVGQNPAFTIKAEYPAILDDNDPGVSSFNTKAHDLIQNGIDEFKRGVSELPDDPNFTSSYLDVKFTLLSQTDGVVSVKFVFSFYAAGAAHPGDYNRTLNYDLDQGRELVLGELFLPDSNYLEVISNYCITELSKQLFFDGAFTDGANPTLENYRNWNITSQGLMITFDTYQVGPGAAGPQVVQIPFEQLSQIIDRNGPLKSILQ